VVVPIRIGGGTRLKILDAWAMGKPVVSTTIGCEGLKATHEENILIADKPPDFADAVARVIGDNDFAGHLGRSARNTAVAKYDWEPIGEGLRQAYRSMLAQVNSTGT
jgi:glycosyltransferase involved in cell wall biosynthesis